MFSFIIEYLWVLSINRWQARSAVSNRFVHAFVKWTHRRIYIHSSSIHNAGIVFKSNSSSLGRSFTRCYLSIEHLVLLKLRKWLQVWSEVYIIAWLEFFHFWACPVVHNHPLLILLIRCKRLHGAILQELNLALEVNWRSVIKLLDTTISSVHLDKVLAWWHRWPLLLNPSQSSLAVILIIVWIH